MGHFSARDVREILQTVEDGITLVPNIGKLDKMKMRSQIRKQTSWLSGLTNPKAELVFLKLQERLSDVFRLYPYGFSERLNKLIHKKVADTESRKYPENMK
jgi:hypothetical protein